MTHAQVVLRTVRRQHTLLYSESCTNIGFRSYLKFRSDIKLELNHDISLDNFDDCVIIFPSKSKIISYLFMSYTMYTQYQGLKCKKC